MAAPPAYVVDLGASTCAMGYAGDDAPRRFLSSTYSCTSSSDDTRPFSAANGDKLVRDLSACTEPDLRTLFDENGDLDHTPDGALSAYLTDGLGYAKSQRDKPLMFVERSGTTSEQRCKNAEVLFEQEGFPGLFMGRDAVLSCYAVGKSTGVVVDISGSRTTVTPVHEGWVESSATLTSPVSGDMMDIKFKEVLDEISNAKHGGDALPKYLAGAKDPEETKEERGGEYFDLMCMMLGRQGREEAGKIADFGYDPDDEKNQTIIPKLFKLPDGKEVEIGIERYESGEMLFGKDCPERELTAGSDSLLLPDPLQNLICDSVFKCERDQQAALLSTVILAGGGSCVEGIQERTRLEVENIIHTHTPGWRVKVLAPAHPERRISSWLGGSILASLGSFGDNWTSKKEYDEYGSSIVTRKCP
ncbi:hypothetical protein TrVE_jg6760 [Triparma verrucosa]|uniref:Actin-related protein 4 n=2 Tax=Triparma TaxID=722752 RepID=A0A9W7B7Z0_9STRA|nr:hypothetical protein TrST_g4737 [Triparma strigata]GMI13420.1 hypothetical protein TrVE_jg6760 [Triparma verrucosa]